MTRRILLLNLLLAALTAVAGWRLRIEWQAARAREQSVLHQPARPAPPPAAAADPPAPTLAPAAYNDIAQKMLFSKDRNPVVVVEAAPPPPPPPMPPLPVFRGVMNVGGPIAIMSESANMPNREFRPGQQVGEFKLVAIGGRDITLEWQGKQIVKSIEELKLREEEKQEPVTRTESPAPAAAPRPPAATTGPGVDLGAGKKACIRDDPTPAGTVVDGLVKVVTQSPFGAMCRWEPAGR